MIEGLYIHIPFCERRCHYCDFNTYEGMTHLAPDYVRAVAKDMALCADSGMRAPEGGLRSVYFGGGTPSMLEAAELLLLLRAARERFGLAEGAEVTVEVNPGTADQGKLESLRRGGFNRVSFGFQAAQDSHLRALGRVHSAEQSDRAWAAARAAGFDNMSLDLMFALSGQTMAQWEESLEWGLARRPEHVSFYGLTVEAGTRFHVLYGQGMLPLPDEELQAGMYELGVRRLADAGLGQYEISNFAAPGRESAHNRLYWLNADTLGVGAGAWSFVDGERSGRVRAPKAYIDAVEAGRLPLGPVERLSGKAARSEAALLRLRMNQGLDLRDWRAAQGGDFLGEFGGALAPAFSAGCLEQDGESVRLTAKGRLLSNEVFVALL
ncbi:MAG TPA: radical SAM family heme chaperone HemW [bacterium]|jgi:oxygen-independent coproporphyrinogen-3 oxidase|nr:radical SAM family heme chaperone HemW [bacterium]